MPRFYRVQMLSSDDGRQRWTNYDDVLYEREKSAKRALDQILTERREVLVKEAYRRADQEAQFYQVGEVTL